MEAAALTTTCINIANDKEEAASPAAPAGTRLTIRLPDDFHHHARDGATTAAVLAHATRRFGRCLVMPNTKPPITTTEMALAYKQHIEKSISFIHGGGATPATTTVHVLPHFQPLLVLYLTDQTTPAEIRKAHAAGVTGCKYYPAGATTNSEFGVTDVKRYCYPALQELSKLQMMLCIHSEVTHGHVDIFDREVAFINEIMIPLVRDFPTLKITMEHISTQEAVDYILSAPDNVKATITCHHLLYNRNGAYNY
jgi:dihydroorotase